MSETTELESQTPTKKPSRMKGCLLKVLVVFVVATVIAVPLLIKLHHLRELVRRASAGNDIWPARMGCSNYAKDHDRFLPCLDTEPGRLMFERNEMHERYGITGKDVTMEFDEQVPFPWIAYKNDPALLKRTDLINDHSWWYLGYVVRNDEEGKAFLRAYLREILEKERFKGDMEDPVTGTKIPRLRMNENGFDKPLTEGPESKIPIFIQPPGRNEGYSGGWVTYLDGHSDFLDYPGKFPMSPEFIRVLQAIDKVGEALSEQ